MVKKNHDSVKRIRRAKSQMSAEISDQFMYLGVKQNMRTDVSTGNKVNFIEIDDRRMTDQVEFY